MQILTAQKEIRITYHYGAYGQLVSGLIWLLSTITTQLLTNDLGFVILIGFGFWIFPLTKLSLKLFKISSIMSKDNPFNSLAMQIAFIVPLSLPLILLTLKIDRIYFYPAFALIIGVHYLPFIFLYGMKDFGVLAGLIISTSIFFIYVPFSVVTAGWTTSILLLAFSIYQLVKNGIK